MSAYLVNLDTLELLASVLCDWNPERHDTGQIIYLEENDQGPLTEGLTVESSRIVRLRYSDNAAVVRELYAANVASLAARYNDWQELIGYTLPDNYKARRVDRDEATLAEAAGAMKCYRYQSSEVPEWSSTFAHALTRAISERLLSIISEDCWEYERPANQPVRVSLMDFTR